MEFLLVSVYYLYNYYMVCALLSHSHSCDSIMWHLLCDTFPHSSLYSKSKRKRKEKKYKWLSCFAKSWHNVLCAVIDVFRFDQIQGPLIVNQNLSDICQCYIKQAK